MSRARREKMARAGISNWTLHIRNRGPIETQNWLSRSRSPKCLFHIYERPSIKRVFYLRRPRNLESFLHSDGRLSPLGRSFTGLDGAHRSNGDLINAEHKNAVQ